MDLSNNTDADDAFNIIKIRRKNRHSRSSRNLTTTRRNLAQTVQPIINNATQAYISGDHETAASHYKEAIDEYPKVSDGYLGLSDIYSKHDRELESLALSIIGAKLSAGNANYWLNSARKALDMHLFNICVYCVSRAFDSKNLENSLEMLVESTQFKISSLVALHKLQKAKDCLKEYLTELSEKLSAQAPDKLHSAAEATLMMAADESLKVLHDLQINPSLYDADAVYDFCEEILIIVCARLSNAFPVRFIQSKVTETFQCHLLNDYASDGSIQRNHFRGLSEEECDYWLQECLGLYCCLEWEACARFVLNGDKSNDGDENNDTVSTSEAISKHLSKIRFAVSKVGIRISSIAENIGHLTFGSSLMSNNDQKPHPRSIVIHASHSVAEMVLYHFHDAQADSPASRIKTVLSSAVDKLMDCRESDDDTLLESTEFWTICNICQVIGRIFQDEGCIVATVSVLKLLGDKFVEIEMKIICEFLQKSKGCLLNGFLASEFIRCLNTCALNQQFLPFYDSLLTFFVIGFLTSNDDAIISIASQVSCHFKHFTISNFYDAKELGLAMLHECVAQLKASLGDVYSSHKVDKWKQVNFPDFSDKIESCYFVQLPDQVKFFLTSRLKRIEKSRADRKSKRRIADDDATSAVNQTDVDGEVDEEERAEENDGTDDYNQSLITITVEERGRRKDEIRCLENLLPFIRNIFVLFSNLKVANAVVNDDIKVEVCDLFIAIMSIVSLMKGDISESLSQVVNEQFLMDPIIFVSTNLKQSIRSVVFGENGMKQAFLTLANECLTLPDDEVRNRCQRMISANELISFTRNMNNCIVLDLSEYDRSQLQKTCFQFLVKDSKEPKDPVAKKPSKEKDPKPVVVNPKDEFATLVFKLKRDGDVTEVSYWLHSRVFSNISVKDELRVILKVLENISDSESCAIFNMSSVDEDDDELIETDLSVDVFRSALYYLTASMKMKSFQNLCLYALCRYREVCTSFELQPVLEYSSAQLFLNNCLLVSDQQMNLLSNIESLALQEILFNYARFMTLTSSSKTSLQFIAFEKALWIHDCKKSDAIFEKHCLTREIAFNFCLFLNSAASFVLSESIATEYM